MSRDERIAEILAEWRAARQAGGATDAEALVRAHPDLADDLRARVAAIDVLDQIFAVGQAGAAVPERLGEYRLIREIGRGGMGVVYEAEQTSMRRRVALKVLFPSVTSSPKALKRFQQEAWAAGRLKHTNIVAVHQLGHDGGVWYCAMELVEGRPLSDVIADLLRAGKRPRESGLARRALGGQSPGLAPDTATGTRAYYARVAEMFAEVAEALQVAHDHGVVHRDVKPANLLLDAEGRLKLADFGLARLEEGAAAMTMTGEMLGTPLYMSPEQIPGGRGGVDARTDVYSLGATLYEVLTLRPPFRGRSLHDLSVRILTKDPERPSRADSHVPRDLETIVLKAMEKDRDRRYSSAEAFARDLRRFATGTPVEARRIGVAARASRWINRNRVRASAAASILVLVGMGTYLGVRAASEGARRRQLEYSQLCALAGHAAIAELSRSSQDGAIEANSAASLFTEAIDLAPDRPEAFLGRALAPGRAPEECLRDLCASRDRGLSARTYHLARAHFLQRAGRAGEAVEDLARAREEPGRDPLDQYFEAFQLAKACRWADASDALTRLLSATGLDPTVRCLAFTLRAQVGHKTGEHSRALEDLVRLQTLGDESASLCAGIASAWRRMDPKTAERSFDEAMQHAAASGAERTWIDLCRTVQDNEEYDWLDRATTRAIEAHPASTRLLLFRSVALRHLGRPEEALDTCDRAIGLGPMDAEAHKVRAGALSELGRLDDALAEYDRAIGLDPKLGGAHNNRGLALRALGRLEDALAAYDQAIGLDLTSVAAHSNRGVVLRELGRYDEALAECDRAVELEPQLAGPRDSRGLALLALGRRDDAISEFDLAIQLDPELASAHSNRGLALRRPEDALLEFERAAALAPHEAYPRNNRGTTLLDLGRPEEALAEFDVAIGMDPNDAEFHMNRGTALRRLGRPEEALKECERAIGLDGKSAKAHVSRGNALQDLGRREQALAEFELAIGLDPQLAGAHSNRANVLRDLGRPGDALTECDLAIQLDPKAASPHLNRGAALLDLGRPKDALEEFDLAIQLDPKMAQAHCNRGNMLRELGRPEEALEAYERAIGLDPRNANTGFCHGNALFALGRCDDALAAYNAAIALDPKDVRFHVNRGNTLRRLGRPEEALVAYSHAIDLDPRDARAHNGRAGALYELGRYEDAVAAYGAALDLKPGYMSALTGLAWTLANGPKETVRDAARAIDLARKAAAAAPKDGDIQNTLGIALYRAGEMRESLRVFEESMRLSDGGDPNDWFFMAMAHARLGEGQEARELYDRAVAWTNEHARSDPDLSRFQEEAAGVLGVK